MRTWRTLTSQTWLPPNVFVGTLAVLDQKPRFCWPFAQLRADKTFAKPQPAAVLSAAGRRHAALHFSAPECPNLNRIGCITSNLIS
jgi:hypothetical protein